ncbi:hypothetical protein E3P99_02889 [Wallemia hederae]|uniref:Uncharacterized protein n=1 Tax=Wallemia hederae TaxID=1540922 RepID=A0A4T0FIV4_9BASI|nr:hypothetical protein E3P99_02889 [Wallemia hederae]
MSDYYSEEDASYRDSEDEDSEIDYADMDDVTGRREAQELLDRMLVEDTNNDDIAEADGDDEEGAGEAGHSARLSILQMLLRNARAGSGGRVFVMNDNDDDDDDDYLWQPRMRGERYTPTPSAVQSAGVKLSRSGMFGYASKHTTLSTAIRNRMRTFDSLRPEYFTRIPNSSGCLVARNSAPVYSGEYSRDGELFYTADRNFNINVYQPQKSLRSAHSGLEGEDDSYIEEHETTMAYQARYTAIPHGWTITDSHLSSDKQWLVYSRISPYAHIVNLNDPSRSVTPISFQDDGVDDYGYGYGIWSLRFSSDCKEIVAGAADGTMYVYDLEARRKLLSLEGHMADVNAVCFADVTSNICVSGSDDCVAKVWDRRALTSQYAKPSGVLVGHTEGITYVSPRGDARHILTNSKDSSIRVWDLRWMTSVDDFDDTTKVAPPENFSVPGYDYRSSFVPKPAYDKHPQDHSLVTLRGHLVSRTLIRARFSPDSLTGGRYVYSGSADGKIYVWSITGELVQVIDRKQALNMVDGSGRPSDPSAPEKVSTAPRGNSRRPIIRDVSWSPTSPSMMSTAWEWDETGSVARHDWKELNKLNYSLEDWVDIHNANE